MRLDTPFVKLPFSFDAKRLEAEVTALPESVWRPHPQGYVGNSALPLVSAWGNPDDDRTSGPMQATPHLSALPYLRQVMRALDAPIGRSRLMRIDGNAEVGMHVDTNYYWATHARVHVPIVTTPRVRFICRDSEVNMAPGECWIFDTWSKHNVINPEPTRRIHLVCDTVGSARFWARAMGHSATAADVLPFAADDRSKVPFESCNQPVVMTPFEVIHWCRFVLDELRTAQPDAQNSAALASRLLRFQQAWTSAWARFGAASPGHDRFANLLRAFDAALDQLPASWRAPNGTSVSEMLRQLIVRSALNPDLIDTGSSDPRAGLPLPAQIKASATDVSNQSDNAQALCASALDVAVMPAATPPQRLHGDTAKHFDRPIFIVAAPRSGKALLFDALAQSPDAWAIRDDCRHPMESIPDLRAERHSYSSDRADATSATPMVVAELTHGIFGQVSDRNGKPATAVMRSLRVIDNAPKNSLRVPFLAAAYPDAHFVYLHRDVRDTISSMLDAWRSGKFVTYPRLPGWTGAPWSLLLTSEWRALNGLALHDVVAQQWRVTMETLIADLEALPPDRVVSIDHDDLLADPSRCMQALCNRLQLRWDREAESRTWSRPPSTSPVADKWKRNADELDRVLPKLRHAQELALQLHDRQRALPVSPNACELAGVAPPSVSSPAEPSTATKLSTVKAPTVPKSVADFSSVYSAGMPALLAATASSLAITTYQSGRLILLRKDGEAINTHLRSFPSPMGIARNGDRLVLATARQVWEYQNRSAFIESADGAPRHDACFVPRSAIVTGDIRIHEIGFAKDELWLVNTRFSCLATLDGQNSFVPRWKPKFISRLEAEDRCHLNGMCIVDDRIAHVTALAQTDSAGGWRQHKADGGVLIDVASNEIVAQGLSMPHSPRWHQGRMWVLESGRGSLSTIDIKDGRTTVVAELPGFTRGLAFHRNLAFIGLSQVRESVFGGLPLTERLTERLCGIWVVDIRDGKILGFLRFEGTVQEIFDVQILEGLQFPELLEPDDERTAGMFVVP